MRTAGSAPYPSREHPDAQVPNPWQKRSPRPGVFPDPREEAKDRGPALFSEVSSLSGWSRSLTSVRGLPYARPRPFSPGAPPTPRSSQRPAPRWPPAQVLTWYGFSPVWMRTWLLRVCRWRKRVPQVGQG